MRYITADIINQMNEPSGHDERFDNLWNERMDSLQANFDSIKNQLPFSAVNFYENQVLLGYPAFCRSGNYAQDEFNFIIGKEPEKKIIFISYDFYQKPEIEQYSGPGFSLTEPAVWLYDEFHLKKETYEHHIIFSDGMSYIIPFQSMYVRQTSWFDE